MRHRHSHHSSGISIPIGSLGKRTIILAGTVLALLGIALGAGGAMWWQHVRGFVQTAEHADGTVIEIVEKYSDSNSSSSSRSNRHGSYTYYPVVEFTDQQGKPHKFQSNTGSNPSRYFVGDKVPVLYDPARPGSAGIDHWLDLYLGPMVLGILGTVFFIFAIVFLVIGARKSKTPENGETEPVAVPE